MSVTIETTITPSSVTVTTTATSTPTNDCVNENGETFGGFLGPDFTYNVHCGTSCSAAGGINDNLGTSFHPSFSSCVASCNEFARHYSRQLASIYRHMPVYLYGR